MHDDFPGESLPPDETMLFDGRPGLFRLISGETILATGSFDPYTEEYLLERPLVLLTTQTEDEPKEFVTRATPWLFLTGTLVFPVNPGMVVTTAPAGLALADQYYTWADQFYSAAAEEVAREHRLTTADTCMLTAEQWHALPHHERRARFESEDLNDHASQCYPF